MSLVFSLYGCSSEETETKEECRVDADCAEGEQCVITHDHEGDDHDHGGTCEAAEETDETTETATETATETETETTTETGLDLQPGINEVTIEQVVEGGEADGAIHHECPSWGA